MPTQGNRVVQVRVDEATRERWQAAATRDRVALATFIRDAVELRLRADPDALARPAAGRGPRKRAGCSRSRFHRSGTYCRECGVVPS